MAQITIEQDNLVIEAKDPNAAIASVNAARQGTSQKGHSL